MSRPLYAVATEQKTPQQHAREAVKRRREKPPEPIVNIHDQADPAPRLPVDDILRKSQGDHLGKK